MSFKSFAQKTEDALIFFLFCLSFIASQKGGWGKKNILTKKEMDRQTTV